MILGKAAALQLALHLAEQHHAELGKSSSAIMLGLQSAELD
jgi:hypothetical protein